MKVILLVGYKRVGKDEVAKYITSVTDFKQESLAKPIKEIARIMHPAWNDSCIDGAVKEENIGYGYSFRQWAQKFGTEISQFILPKLLTGKKNRTFWCNHLIDRHIYNNLWPGSKMPDLVISDVRFLHEYTYFNSRFDTVTIRIKRGKEKSWWEKLWAHKSEKEQDKIQADYVIENEGTLIDLRMKVAAILDKEGMLKS